MFTGIIEETGIIKNITKTSHAAVLSIEAHIIFSDLNIGDSVSVNGVCLTAVKISGNTFSADIMHETLNRSSLSTLKIGSHVNLERAMPAEGRFGGHIVSGHIDGTGKIIEITKDDNAVWYSVSTSPEIMRYIVEKGSIAIDGISLTVAEISSDSFKVSVIPHTAAVTTLSARHVGDCINLENDIIGKYVDKLLLPPENTRKASKLTTEYLLQNGF